MRTRTVVLRARGQPPVIKEVELKPPQAREVRCKTTASGVCHAGCNLDDGFRTVETSLHVLRPRPGYPGKEQE